MEINKELEINPDFELEGLELTEESSEQEIETGQDNNPSEIEVDEDTQFFYNEFKQRGFIQETDDDKFDGSPEWIDRKLQEYPEIVKSQILSNIPDKHKTFVELVLTKPNLTSEEFESFFQTHIAESSNEISTLDDAREFMEKHLASQGLRPSAIKAQLDEMEDDESLLDKAKQLAGSKKTKTDETLEQIKNQQAENKKRMDSFMEEINKEINQFPEPRRNAILKVAPNVSTIINEISSDPKKYTQFLDLLTYYKNGSFDFSVFKKQAESGVVNSFKERMAQTAQRTARGTTAKQDKFDFELVI